MDKGLKSSSGCRPQSETGRRHSEPSSSLVIDDPEHASSLLAQLNLMRSDDTSADTILLAGGTELPCHRAVLAASSLYFRAMFQGELRESRERRIRFDGVSALALRCLVDYVYTGRIVVTVDDAQDLLAAASLFQYAQVVEACCTFLSTHLHPTNCLRIEAFGHHHNCLQLAQQARHYAIENFESVVLESDEFLEMTAQRLESYISSEEIEVSMEKVVFEALVRWVNVDIGTRKSSACRLMKHVRFASIAADYISSSVLPHPLIAECRDCSTFVADSVKSQLIEPRPSTIAKDVVVVIGGCGSDGTVLTSVEAYSPSKDCWKSLTNVPVAVIYCAVTTVMNDIYISGGIVEGTVVANVWRFITAQQKWVPVTPLSCPRAHHASAAIDTRLYVAGGIRSANDPSGRVVDTIECLNVNSLDHGWHTIVHVPCPRFDSHMVAYGGKELVEVGGLQSAGVVATVEIYACCGEGDLTYSGEQFVLPESIRYAQIAAVGGILYIVWTDGRRLISLNAERRIFRRLADVQLPHVGGKVTVIGERLYITGGSCGEASGDNVEYYDADKDKWFCVQPMLQAREHHGCVTIQMH